MNKRNNLRDKLEILKELGFSDALLKALEEVDYSKVVCGENINLEFIEDPLIVIPNNSNNIIIELSDKPMNFIYNADYLTLQE